MDLNGGRQENVRATIPFFCRFDNICAGNGALFDQCGLGCVFGMRARSARFRPGGAIGELAPLNAAELLTSELGLKRDDELLLVGQGVLKNVVEAAKQRPVEKGRMVGGRDDQTARLILLDHLQERIDDPAHLADVVGKAALGADAVKLVKEIDGTCLCVGRRIASGDW